MANIIEGNPSYTMSLDDIDLDYFFRQIHFPKNGLVKPLWTNNGYKRNDYYEFEIITDNTNDKDDTDKKIYYDHNLICETYICHICNINVPKIYRKEHNLTQKHKVYLEIADKSLERSRKHINEDTDSHKSVVRYDCYFCPSCSAAVATELKGHHEKTPSHLISVKHDDLLKELLKYYIDRDNVKIDFELDKVKVFENLNQIDNTNSNDNLKKKSKRKKLLDQSSNVVVSSTNSTTNVGATDDRVKNGIEDVANKGANSGEASNGSNKERNKIESTNQTSQSPRAVQTLTKNNTIGKELNGTTANDKINEGIDSNGKNPEKDNVQLTIKKKKKTKKIKVDITEVLKGYYEQISFGHTIKFIDNDLLEIEAINGDVVRVAAKSFHAYNEVDGSIRCELCNIFIDDDKESHMFTENHMIYAMTPIVDQNCVRKCNPYYSHCILCNEVVKDVGTHIFNNKIHESKMNNALAVNKTPVKTDIVTVVYQNLSGKTYCEICEVEVGLNNYESHANSKKHRANYDRKYPSLLTSKIIKNVENKEKDNCLLSVANNLDEVICKICKLQFPSKNITEHITGNGHITKYNKILIDNELKVCANGYYCEICKDNVPMYSLMEHVEGREHVSGLNKRISNNKLHDYLRPLGLNTDYIYCKICEINVANESSKIDEHFSSSEHQNNFSDLIKRNNLTEIDEGYQLTYHCSHCNTVQQGKDILEHINNKEHLEAMATAKKQLPPKDSIKIHPHMQTTSNVKELKCKVCLIAVPFLSNSIDEHVVGKNHTKNYNKILEKFHKIDEEYYCDICDVFLNDKLLVDHVHCEDDGQNAAVAASERAEVKMTRGKPIPEGHTPCKICGVSFPNRPDVVERHNNSESHLENCTKIMKYNRFADNDDNYFFELSTVSQSMCSNSSPVIVKDVKKTKPAKSEVIIPEGVQQPKPEIYIPETSQITVSHKHMEVTDKLTSLNCRVCRVPVPNNDNCVNLHVNGLKHKNKYNTLMNDNKLDERTNCFYCGYCETLLSKNLDIDHVFSAEHKIKMNTTTNNIPTTHKQVETPALHYLMEKIENSKYLQCKLCKREIIEEPLCVKYHLESSGHIETYKSFLDKNNVVMKNNTYFCNICNESLADNTEYEHLESKTHKNKQSLNMFRCNICDVLVPNNLKNINEHVRGSSHRSKASSLSDQSD